MVAFGTILGFVWILLWTPYPTEERNRNPIFIAENVPTFLRFLIAMGGLFGALLLIG